MCATIVKEKKRLRASDLEVEGTQIIIYLYIKYLQVYTIITYEYLLLKTITLLRAFDGATYLHQQGFTSDQ